MEIVDLEAAAQPEAAEQEKASAETENIPEAENEVFVPVKFNKEIKNLGLKEAAALAQKGLKFEAIADDFAALKSLAAKGGHSVSEYIAELQGKMMKTAGRSLQRNAAEMKKWRIMLCSLRKAERNPMISRS